MERKLREINGSYVITIPKQICDLYDFKLGDNFKLESIGANELRFRKIEKRSMEDVLTKYPD
jgi:hypothetical protein